MTRRERLEHKLEKRQEWAGKAEQRAEQRFNTAHQLLEDIPPGQPILIGHHSEARHRRTLDRHDANMSKGVEEYRLSQHHSSKAVGLEHQLNTSIFSDDPDAVEALEAKIADLEAKAERDITINKAWRKHKGDVAAILASGLITEQEAKEISALMRICPYLSQPCSTTNTRANIRRLKERIEDIKRQQQRQAETEAAGGVLISESADDDYCAVRFAEKPEYSIIRQLKDAGFWFGRGAWTGLKEKLPADVRALTQH